MSRHDPDDLMSDREGATPWSSMDDADRRRFVRSHARRLRDSPPDQIVAWAVKQFGDHLGFMTSLGFGGLVLIDLLRRRLPVVHACFVDTGAHFDETLELLERVRTWSESDGSGRVCFTVLRPTVSSESLIKLAGSPPWQHSPDVCCRLRKVEPMRAVLPTREAWMSALRREQGGSRMTTEVVRLDAGGAPRIHPLAFWRSAQCWDYIRSRGIPYNPLHDCGYSSVGCVHCTVPVIAGEGERTGRWVATDKTECGLHTLAPEPGA